MWNLFFDKLLWMWRYNCKQLKILENWSLKERQPQSSYFPKFDFLLFLFCLIDMFSPSLSQFCDKKKIQKLYEQFHKTYNHGNKLLPKKFTWLLILPIYRPWCIIKVPFLLQVYIYDVTKMMMVIWKTWRNYKTGTLKKRKLPLPFHNYCLTFTLNCKNLQ